MDSTQIKIITSKNEFTQIITNNKNVLVDFYADWCQPCKVIAPKFEEFSRQYPNIVFAKVNTDTLPEVSNQADIKAIPTFILFKDGKPFERLTGANPAKLQELIQKA